MAAKITLELDDRTAKPFADLAQNVNATDQAVDQLAGTAGKLAKELSPDVPAEYSAEVARMREESISVADAIDRLAEQQAAQTAATERQTTAIAENRAGFMEWTNTVADFARNMRDAGKWTAEQTGKLLAQGKAVSSGATGWTAFSVGLKIATKGAIRIGVPLAAARVAMMGFGFAASQTGEKIVAMEGPASEAARRLAAEINSGLSTVDEVTARTGKTLDQLGLRVENNLTRMQAADKRALKTAGNYAGSILGNMASAVAEMTGIPQAIDAIGTEIDEAMTRFAKNNESNMRMLEDAMHDFMGVDGEHIRAQEAFFEKEAALAPIREAYKELEGTKQKQIELSKEMRRVAGIDDAGAVDRAITAERKRREEMLQTGRMTTDEFERVEFRILALMDRREQVQIEKQRAWQDRMRKANAENARIDEREHREKMARIEEQRKADADRLQAFIARRRQHAADGKSLETQAAVQQLQLIDDQLQRKLDAELTADLEKARNDDERLAAELKAAEKQADAKLKITKSIIAKETRAAVEAAKTIEETQRAQYESAKRYQDAEFEHKRETAAREAQLREEHRQREVAAAREQFAAEVDLLKQKLLAEKRLRGGGSTTGVGQLANRLDPRRVVDQLVKQRTADGATATNGKKLTPQEIRRQVIRQLKSQQIDPAEVQKAQLQLIRETANQGAKSGQLSKAAANAMNNAAKSLQDQQAEIAKNTAELEKMAETLKAGNDDFRKRQQAQRRGRG